MKHLPNILTLANLFSGCLAIAFILNAQPYLAEINGADYWVICTEQMVVGAYLIGIAAIFDLLDGFAARALQVFSPIGKDLDSLADLVSFGVAPSMLLMKMLWAAKMQQSNAMDVSMWAMAPAFLVACFGALRLARFNITAPSKGSYTFQGMPIPATGIFVASIALLNWYAPVVGVYFQKTWILYVIIALLCWLMISKIPFFKFIPAAYNIKNTWRQLVLIVVFIATAIFISLYVALPITFVIYILLSIIIKPSEEQ